MSRLPSTSDSVIYPESDGEPMAETDVRYAWMVRIRDQLDNHFRGQRVYVATNLLLYYVPGQPRFAVAPDEFVVLDCPPGMRRVFKTWEEERVPDFVLEVTSLSTRRKDEVEKRAIYQQIGVREYFLYDPTADYLQPPLCGFRLNRAQCLEPLPPEPDGRLRAETLQLTLALSGDDLVLRDTRTGRILPTRAEAETAAKRMETSAKMAALRKVQAEAAAKEAALRLLDRERAARQMAETRMAELEAELRRLRSDETGL